jgi:hypothetical protein
MPGKSEIIVVLTAALLLGWWAETAEAQQVEGLQQRPVWLVGYSVKPPQQLLGGGLAAILSPSGRWGFLTDGRISTDGPQSRFLRPTVEAGTLPSGSRKETWSNVNVAVLRAMTPELGLYAGGGVSWSTATYAQYERWQEGQPVDMYWVETEGTGEVEANLVVGGLLRMASRIFVQFGWQTAPSGFTVGGFFRVR